MRMTLNQLLVELDGFKVGPLLCYCPALQYCLRSTALSTAFYYHSQVLLFGTSSYTAFLRAE